MKARPVVLSLATFFVALTSCFGQDAMMGTWKLNEAKSKIAAGSPKNNTVVIEAAGENVKVSMDGVDPTGKPTLMNGAGSLMAKRIRSPATPIQTLAHTKKSTTEPSKCQPRKEAELRSPAGLSCLLMAKHERHM